MLAARALPPARGVLPLRARASSTARGRRAAAAVVVVPRAAAGKGFDASAVTGGLEKKRCDLCLGTGTRKCYNCHVAEGWREKNFSTSKCERAGYVPIKIGGFLGIGGKDGEGKCGVCNDGANPAKKPGTIQCSRCKGKKFVYYRNADWR